MKLKDLNATILQQRYVLLLDKIKKYLEQKLNKKIKLNSDENGVYINLSSIEYDEIANDTLKIFDLKKRNDNSYYIVIIKSMDINAFNKLEHQLNKLLQQSKNKNQSSKP